MIKFFKNAGELLKEELFPRNLTCDLCGRESFEGNLCPDCRKTVIKNDGHCCPVCGRRYFDDILCVECKAEAPVHDGAVSALVYVDGTVGLVNKFKKGGAYLKEYFADLIFEKLEKLDKFDLILSVPMTAKDKRKRGYNQTELLAAALSLRCGVPYEKGVLEKTGKTAEQKSLNRKERTENLKGSFKVAEKEKIKQKSVLIVDDVMTTGATIDELSRVLKKAGAAKVFAATVAAVEYEVVKI